MTTKPNMQRKCQICNREYKKSPPLVTHIRKVHIEQERYIVSLEEYHSRFICQNPRKTCSTCGVDVKFDNIDVGWVKHCSHECAVNNPDVAKRRNENTKKALEEKYGQGVTNPSCIPGTDKKRKATKLQRYGDENYVNVEKIQQTCLEHWGHITATGSPEYMRKTEETCMRKYGVKHQTQSEISKSNSRRTCMERYGVPCTLSVPSIRKKINATCIERYGGIWLQSEEIREKTQQTMLKRYGTRYPGNNPIIKARKEATCLERYGFIYPVQSRKVLHKILSSQARRSYKCRKYRGVVVQSHSEEKFVDQQLELNNHIKNGPALAYMINGKARVYHVDFLVTYNDDAQRLIEVKQRHGWFRRECKDGTFRAKVKAAQLFSRQCGYLPFKVRFDDK